MVQKTRKKRRRNDLKMRLKMHRSLLKFALKRKDNETKKEI